MNYIVVRVFEDKYSQKYYSVGENYDNTQDQARIRELESGGFIAAENTEVAAMAKAQAEANKIVQAEAQKLAAAHAQAAQAAEPKTVVNGKVVPLKVAQAAETFADQQVKKTGIRQAHDNSTEPVQAGMIAHDTNNTSISTAEASQVQAQQAVRAADVQSGQQELEKAMQNQGNVNQFAEGKTQGSIGGTQNVQQQEQQTFEQQAQNMHQVQTGTKRADAMAAAEVAMHTNPADAVHEEAAQAQKAAAETKTRGAKKQ